MCAVLAAPLARQSDHERPWLTSPTRSPQRVLRGLRLGEHLLCRRAELGKIR